MPDNFLDELAIKYGTDKSSLHHNYTKYYSTKFSKSTPVKLLEIGVSTGASMGMWLEYFDKIDFIGVDKKIGIKIDDELVVLIDKTIELIEGYQLDSRIMNIVLKKGPYDIIIDDGSHRPEDQQGCFSFLFPLALKAGGIYVIEDLQTTRTTKMERTLDILKQLRDTSKYPKEGYIWSGALIREVSKIDAMSNIISKTVRKCQIFDDKIAFIYKQLFEGAVE